MNKNQRVSALTLIAAVALVPVAPVCAADAPKTDEDQSTNVLIKRDGRWQAVASHVSGIERSP
jgi:hypothetical protein